MGWVYLPLPMLEGDFVQRAPGRRSQPVTPNKVDRGPYMCGVADRWAHILSYSSRLDIRYLRRLDSGVCVARTAVLSRLGLASRSVYKCDTFAM